MERNLPHSLTSPFIMILCIPNRSSALYESILSISLYESSAFLTAQTSSSGARTLLPLSTCVTCYIVRVLFSIASDECTDLMCDALRSLGNLSRLFTPSSLPSSPLSAPSNRAFHLSDHTAESICPSFFSLIFIIPHTYRKVNLIYIIILHIILIN